MRFRLNGGNLHVHGCVLHPKGCDFFDHAPAWMIGSREDARAQLHIYRRSVVAQITRWSAVLVSIDLMLGRLERLSVAA